MKQFRIPLRILEVILIIAAIIASIYVFSVIFGGLKDIAAYNKNPEEATDPTLGLAIAGVILFAVGVYYAGASAVVGLIATILAFVNNKYVKSGQGTKKTGVVLPIILTVYVPMLVLSLVIFLQSLDALIK